MSPPIDSPDVDRGARRATEAEPPAQAFGEALHQFAELRAIVSYYVSTKIDSIKLTIRSLIIWAALGVVGLIAAAAIVAMAVVQVLGGIAGAIANLVPSHPWIGSLVTGIVVLAVVVIGVRWGVGFVTRASKAAIVAKYEALKREQRQQFGRNVDDEAHG